MDCIVGLPRTSKHHDAIWVIVDQLTKLAHFLAIKVIFTAEQLADLYIREVVQLHEIPLFIVSDCDPKFIFKFWHRFQSVVATELCLSIAFHPQSNGQLERTIQSF